MAVAGPIILIEDDRDDVGMIRTAFKDIAIPNDVHWFKTTKEALDYLLATGEKPYLILCDIMLPERNGLDFRHSINTNDFLRRKSIPFIFFTAIVSEEIICNAYDLNVQGFFKKPLIYEELKTQLASIALYWSKCLHPNV